MPINWTTSSGQPLDSVGADGDMDFDFANRFQWGPKGRITPGSWVGTANNVNPLYANLGPAAYGQAAPAVFNGTLTSTPQVMLQANSGNPYVITVTTPTNYYGTIVTSGAANTLELFNLTTGTSVYSGQSSAVSTTVYGPGQPFQAGQYVLLPGNSYVFRLTGSATGQIGAWPLLAVPSQGLGQAISSLGPIQFSTNTSFSSTGLVPNIGLSNVGFYWRPLRPTVIYNVVATFTPSGSSTAANSLNIFMNTQNSGGTVSTYTNFGKVFGTGKPTAFGPYTPQQLGITSGNQYWFVVTSDSACTGTLTLDLQVVI